MARMQEIRRRPGPGSDRQGFDALGLMLAPLDFSNDLLVGVGRGEVAVMEFLSFEGDGSVTYRIGDVSCY